MRIVQLLLELKREFGVTISAREMEIENFGSIARIADFIAARVEKPRAVQLRASTA